MVWCFWHIPRFCLVPFLPRRLKFLYHMCVPPWYSLSLKTKGCSLPSLAVHTPTLDISTFCGVYCNFRSTLKASYITWSEDICRKLDPALYCLGESLHDLVSAMICRHAKTKPRSEVVACHWLSNRWEYLNHGCCGLGAFEWQKRGKHWCAAVWT